MFWKLFAYFRLKKGKEETNRITERFGNASAYALQKFAEYKHNCNQLGIESKTIWVHAVSVGESLSVLEFINKLSDENYFVILTTMTTTSANIVSNKISTNVVHQYSPYQANKYIKKFLQTWQPEKVFFTESEIFPNIINILNRQKTSLYLLNARMSEKSFRMWKMVKFYVKRLLIKYTYIFPLSENEMEKFKYLSDGQAKIKCLGNLKFDTAIRGKQKIEYDFEKNTTDVAKCKLLKQMCETKKIIVFGSIHKEEFFHLLWQYALLMKQLNCIGIFVPRHLEDCKNLEKKAYEADFEYSYWSDFCGGECGNLIIVNEMNILPKLYKVCDIAVICGSFVDGIGGHNPIESVVFAKPTFIGKYCCKSQDLVDQLSANNLIVQTQNLCNEVVKFCTAPLRLSNLQKNVDIFLQQHANVADKILGEVKL